MLRYGVPAFIMGGQERGKLMNNSSYEPNDEQPKWRGRIAVLLLVIGGLVLLMPTFAIFLAGSD
ncbi:MAG: hypothetical protein P8N17_07955 [Luminiphilus sp.]|nr:hypothetical protein [Luminiphilus sp.]